MDCHLGLASDAIDLSAFQLVDGQHFVGLPTGYSELVDLNGHLQDLATEPNCVDEQVSFEQKDVLQDLVSNLLGPTASETDENFPNYTELQLAQVQVACFGTDSTSQQLTGYYESPSTCYEEGAPSHTREPHVKVNVSDNEENGAYTEDPYVKITNVNDREVHIEV
jgi:hypothetical protein